MCVVHSKFRYVISWWGRFYILLILKRRILGRAIGEIILIHGVVDQGVIEFSRKLLGCGVNALRTSQLIKLSPSLS